MQKTDISKYSYDGFDTDSPSSIPPPKSKRYASKLILILIFRIILSLFVLGATTATIILFSIRAYVLSLDDDSIILDLSTSRMALTSFIYVNDENGVPQEYQRAFNLENRIWIDFKDIPDRMKDAIVAIEDKRFYEHSGVDWVRTLSAVASLLKGSQSHGGSTLTQQLIKNITDDNETSLTRKLREIFRAMHFEEKYSKDEIIEAYLNIVNFGAGSRGVQAAANIYFNKNIQDCSIAECAAIAGITQNPTAYNPFYYPEKNQKRRETVLREMFEQEKITEQEYNQAMEESNKMEFSQDADSENGASSSSVNPVRNWYTEAMLNDVINDLCSKYNIGKSASENILLTGGLKIYSAMDRNAQDNAESAVKDSHVMPTDKELEIGYVMMGFDGRILATLGCREQKTGNLWYDRANFAKRQPGSTMKPISVYAPAIESGAYTYSSLINDEPLQIDADGSGELRSWPNNWYKGYKGKVTLQWALEKSANAPAAQVLHSISTTKSYEFLTQKLGFSSLDSSDALSLSALATGGTHVGVTVREMTAAFQIFGNGGQYCKPYSYFYVTDRNDKVILDNRYNIPTQAISSQTATIMNRLLRNVIVGSEGTGRGANIDKWNIIGKTGTTNDDHDSWFIGLSPYAVSGVWVGYDNPKRIHETASAIRIWKHIMSNYLSKKEKKDFDYDPNVIEATYCKSTGEMANSSCPDTAVGYYANNGIPARCSTHKGASVNDKVAETHVEKPLNESSNESNESLVPRVTEKNDETEEKEEKTDEKKRNKVDKVNENDVVDKNIKDKQFFDNFSLFN